LIINVYKVVYKLTRCQILDRVNRRKGGVTLYYADRTPAFPYIFFVYMKFDFGNKFLEFHILGNPRPIRFLAMLGRWLWGLPRLEFLRNSHTKKKIIWRIIVI